MAIPVYVVTGFLDSGKTTFLNHLLNRLDWQNTHILAVQFESGETDLLSKNGNFDQISFPKKILDSQPEAVVEALAEQVRRGASDPEKTLDEIWVEWNGVAPFSRLQDMLLHPSLRGLCKIKRVIHIANTPDLQEMLGKTGSALPEQIANSDFALVRGARTPAALGRIRNLLRGVNPGVRVYGIKSYNDFYRQLFRKKHSPLNIFFLLTVFLIGIYFAAMPFFEKIGVPANKIVNVFLGIILQAIPFLLIGVLISSAIDVFVSKAAIERRFPKTVGLGMLAAIIAGFCLPVCDCASIPIFRSLVKKGVPVPVAVTFMTATPVINPVVIFSTYYAFNGSLAMVVGRVGFGIISAILIGLAFSVWPHKGRVLSGGALDRLMCSCGCYEDVESITTFKGKADLFVRHAQSEFWNVGKYLVIGTFLSAVFQGTGISVFATAQSGAGLMISIIIMMIFGFVLSLCSSSDAVIARSFANQFPIGALLGFLVFGPMLDIKNVLMLSAGFSRRFIFRLTVTAFVVCFGVVFLMCSQWGGVV
jgi:uncharacterized membrane protein YraQ (UPF0718 family)